jgi:hypothetical protein
VVSFKIKHTTRERIDSLFCLFFVHFFAFSFSHFEEYLVGKKSMLRAWAGTLLREQLCSRLFCVPVSLQGLRGMSSVVDSPAKESAQSSSEGIAAATTSEGPRQQEAKAVLTGIRVSPQKLNVVAGLIRGLSVQEALNQLKLSKKRIADTVYKVSTRKPV